MRGGRRAVFLSSVRWNHTWQRHHSLARAAAEDGWSVDFLDPHPRSVRHVVRHLTRSRPDPNRAGVRQPVPPGVRVHPDWWRKPWLLRRLRADRYDLCHLTLPSRPFLRLVPQAGCPVRVYDRLVDWARAPQAWVPAGWAAVEDTMSRTGWTLTADGPGSVACSRSPATIIGPAADAEFLDHRWRGPTTTTVGYFGAVHGELDVPLYCAVARSRPVEFIGPVQDAEVAATLRGAGVRIRPAVPVGELPAVIDDWAAVTLFYRGERASTIVPAKLWNCVASRRPVLVSGLSLADDAAAAVTVVRGHEDVVGSAFPSRDPVRIPTWQDRWRELLAAGTGRA